MEGEGKYLNLEDLQIIHANKTGKLLAFPFQAAGIIAGLDVVERIQRQPVDANDRPLVDIRIRKATVLK